MYKYYIVYEESHSKGSCGLSLKNKITSIEDVEKVEETLRKIMTKKFDRIVGDIIILNFILLEEE